MTTPSGSALSSQLRTALRDLRIELSTHTARIADVAGLNDSDLAVLDVLAREGTQTPSSLARRTGMHPATMTAVLRRLVNSGWVTRRATETDLRSARIEPAAAHRLTAIYQEGNLRLEEVAADFTPEEQRTILAYLEAAGRAVRAASDDLDEKYHKR